MWNSSKSWKWDTIGNTKRWPIKLKIFTCFLKNQTSKFYPKISLFSVFGIYLWNVTHPSFGFSKLIIIKNWSTNQNYDHELHIGHGAKSRKIARIHKIIGVPSDKKFKFSLKHFCLPLNTGKLQKTIYIWKGKLNFYRLVFNLG